MKDSSDTALTYSAQEIAPTSLETEAANLITAITKAAVDPRVDVEKMTALFDLQQKVMRDQKQTAFNAAMARLQSKLPQITKDGIITGRNKAGQTVERSRYARLETIDEAIRPLLAEEGFSFSFNEEKADGQNRTYSAKLSHRDGHSETKLLTLPIDVNEYRTSIQNAASTNAYARRYLIKMHLNLVEVGEDRDGNRPPQPITDDQAKDLETKVEEVGGNKQMFLQTLGASSFESITTKQWHEALQLIEDKRRAKKGGK